MKQGRRENRVLIYKEVRLGIRKSLQTRCYELSNARHVFAMLSACCLIECAVALVCFCSGVLYSTHFVSQCTALTFSS